jgi:hypothetical protein
VIKTPPGEVVHKLLVVTGGPGIVYEKTFAASVNKEAFKLGEMP